MRNESSYSLCKVFTPLVCICPDFEGLMITELYIGPAHLFGGLGPGGSNIQSM